MKLMELNTERLNLNIPKITLEVIKEKAFENGFKPGQMARFILNEWADKKRNDNES